MTIAETIPIPNEFDDDNDFWPHPIYDRYEANRNGIIRHVINKKPVGFQSNLGYYRVTVRDNGKKKNFLSHRFLYECFHGQITDKRVVDHVNNIKTDNRLDNLQLISQSENMKKDHKGGKSLAPIKIKAINMETGEWFEYESIKKTAKDLNIDTASIRKVLKGTYKTALSKKYNQRFRFEKI